MQIMTREFKYKMLHILMLICFNSCPFQFCINKADVLFYVIILKKLFGIQFIYFKHFNKCYYFMDIKNFAISCKSILKYFYLKKKLTYFKLLKLFLLFSIIPIFFHYSDFTIIETLFYVNN